MPGVNRASFNPFPAKKSVLQVLIPSQYCLKTKFRERSVPVEMLAPHENTQKVGHQKENTTLGMSHDAVDRERVKAEPPDGPRGYLIPALFTCISTMSSSSDSIHTTPNQPYTMVCLKTSVTLKDIWGKSGL